MNKKDLQNQIKLLFNRWLLLDKSDYTDLENSLIFIFENNSIKLRKIQRNTLFNIYAYDEFFSNNKSKTFILLKKFQNFFEIINKNKNQVLFLFEKRLFKIYFNNKFDENIENIKPYLNFFYRLKLIYSSNYLWKYINVKFSSIFNKDVINKLTYDEFLKLDLSNQESFNHVRQKNMNMLNNSGKNIYVKDILNFFKKKKIIKKNLKIFFYKSQFYKSIKSKIPIYCNVNYWNSSNFFLISNIIYGFYNKGFQYEKQTSKKNFFKLYSSKIKIIKNKNKIKQIVNSSDLIIIGNQPKSSRNRLLAMIGYILRGGRYISFNYRKYFDNDTPKQKLINLFAEYFSIFHYKKVKLLKLDNNYKKVFEDRGINVEFSDKVKNDQQANVILVKNYKVRKFKFIEINNFLNIGFILSNLMLSKKRKSTWFYIDHKRKSNFFIKKNFFKHSIKILITIIKLKPKILIAIE